MQEIRNYADITKAANAMQRERDIQQEINRQAPLIDPDRFEQSFYDVFCSDDPEQKHKTLVDIHTDHGVSIHGF